MGREGLWALVGHMHPEWSSSTDLLENCRTRVNLDLSKKRQSLMHAQKMEEPMYVCDQAERRKQTKSNMASASKKREPSSKTRLKSSRRASSPAPTKNPWDGYDWDNMQTWSSSETPTTSSAIPVGILLKIFISQRRRQALRTALPLARTQDNQ